MLNGLQEDNWYICLAYINELLELNNNQHSRKTRGANFTILPRKYTREKEGGRLRHTRFTIAANNRTYLECKSDVFCISMQNQTLKYKFQQFNLSETVKTVEPYEWFVVPLGSVATPCALILND